MFALDDPRLARHKIEFIEEATAVWRVTKRPPFREDFQHFSYILAHPDGLILFDAPPLVTDEAVAAIKAIGSPRLLVVSHLDFIGCAGDWAEALSIPAWMGEGDEPLPGNRFTPDERVGKARKLSENLEVIPVPGHSEGSLAVYWKDAPAGPVLCCGDALTAWEHKDKRVQLCFFQDPPVGEAIKELAFGPVAVLATCGGILKDASGPLELLRQADEMCAKPYRGDKGGVWIDPAD